MNNTAPQRHDILPGSIIAFSGNEWCFLDDTLAIRGHVLIQEGQPSIALTARTVLSGAKKLDDTCVIYVIASTSVGWVELYNDGWFGDDVTTIRR